MAGKSAVLSVKIISDHKDAVKGFDETATKAGKFEGSLEKANKAAVVVGAGALLAGKQLLSMGEDAAQSDARIAQITGNLGGFGNRTDKVAGQVSDMGEELASVTGIDPNVVKQGQAVLLSFESLATTADKVGGTFDRATTAAADLAAAGLGEMEEVSKSLGEALSDPVNELGALGEVGIRFSESQQKAINKMVETGDIAGAQAVILGRVEEKVGGVGAATATASDKMKVGWQLAGEELGTKLLPAFQTFTDYAIIAADWVTQNSDLVLVLAGALGGLALGVMAVNAAVKTWSAITKAATAIQAAFNFVLALNPITLVVLAIIALAVAFVLAYKKVDWFRDAVDAAWKWIKGAAVAVWDFLSKTIPKKAGELKDGAVRKFNELKDGISNKVEAAKDYVVGKFNDLKDRATNAVTGLKDNVVNAVTGLPGKFSQIGSDIIAGLVDALWWGSGDVSGAIADIASNAIDTAKRWLGIASPSKVFKYLGDMTVKGFTDSVDNGRRVVAAAYESMLAPPDAPRVALDVVGARPGSSSTRAGARAAAPTRLEVNFTGLVTDPRAVARELIDALEDHYAMTGETVP